MRRPVEWHEKNLRQIRLWNDKLTRRLDEAKADLAENAADIAKLEHQIARAKLEGKTAFDEARYCAKRETKY